MTTGGTETVKNLRRRYLQLSLRLRHHSFTYSRPSGLGAACRREGVACLVAARSPVYAMHGPLRTSASAPKRRPCMASRAQPVMGLVDQLSGIPRLGVSQPSGADNDKGALLAACAEGRSNTVAALLAASTSCGRSRRPSPRLPSPLSKPSRTAAHPTPGRTAMGQIAWPQPVHQKPETVRLLTY